MKFAPSISLLFAFQSPATLTAQQAHLRSGNDDDTKSRHLIDEVVCVPEELYYVAAFKISTLNETKDCTEAEIAGVVKYIDARFLNYSTIHEVLGPLDVEQFGSSCDIEFLYPGLGACGHYCANDNIDHRRHLHARHGGKDPISDASKNARKLLYSNVIQQRRGAWMYTNGAACRFCNPDNGDYGRRQLRKQEWGNNSADGQSTTQTAFRGKDDPPTIQGHRLTEEVGKQQVLIRLVTDDKPWETSYSISEVDGPQVHSKGGFTTKDDSQQEMVHLKKGKQYIFDIHDSEGDGFADQGGVDLFFGGVEFRVPFGEIHGNFGVQGSIKFTASGLADAAGTETDPEDPFPTLQHDISEQISLYVRRKFHKDPTHCLHNTNPSVWVNLSTATKEEAKTVCSTSTFSWFHPPPVVPVSTPTPTPPNPVTAAAPPPPNPVVTPSPSTTPVASTNWKDWTLSTDKRCGSNEPDARGNCGATCSNAEDCPIPGHWCFGVHDNYCGSKPQPAPTGDCSPKRRKRCGVSELHARETCGKKCRGDNQCASGESCYRLEQNFCHC